MGALVRIVVRELPGALRSDEPPKYEAATESGEVLVARTPQPFFAGARALMARGLDPDTLVTMRWAKSASDSFVPVPVSVAAGLHVEEGNAAARIRKWRDPAEMAARGGRIRHGQPSRVFGHPDHPSAPNPENQPEGA